MTTTTTGKLNLTDELELKQGADWELAVQYHDDAGAVVDITGYTGSIAFRREYGTDVLASADIDLTDPTQGQFVVALTNAQTDALPAPTVLVYDLLIESPGGVRTRLLEGKAVVSPKVVE